MKVIDVMPVAVSAVTPIAKSTATHHPRRRQAGLSRLSVVAGVALLALVGWRLVGHVHARTELASQTQALAQLSVSVVRPSPGGAVEEMVLPGTLKAWAEAPIYARTGGYLKRWLVDIGQPVKAGQLLAEIDTPEVEQQLRQAEADLATIQVNAQLAHNTAERYRLLMGSKAVSQQDADDRIGDAQAKQAAVSSAQANVQRLRELRGFARVLAPFDGGHAVVAAHHRRTDAAVKARQVGQHLRLAAAVACAGGGGHRQRGQIAQ